MSYNVCHIRLFVSGIRLLFITLKNYDYACHSSDFAVVWRAVPLNQRREKHMAMEAIKASKVQPFSWFVAG
jgi:hypothetical protein